MAALNSQTAVQFQQYAAQQYPGNYEQQQILIRQLQEQHYQQYMQQLYQVQLAQQQVWEAAQPAASGVSFHWNPRSFLTVADEFCISLRYRESLLADLY